MENLSFIINKTRKIFKKIELAISENYKKNKIGLCYI